MINKVATTHCSFLRLQIKREDISTNAASVTKTELYTILRDVCIVSRDVCIVSNKLTCIDSKLSEMEILAQPLSLPFIIENLIDGHLLATSPQQTTKLQMNLTHDLTLTSRSMAPFLCYYYCYQPKKKTRRRKCWV
jgi:hypothetical protein